ncbi:MAG: hypothetical protein LC117_01775 [Bacteroidia bacterium]|nr:hypothetical protein [Bacteroidia bacterium]MCZ2276644.1 hypothetical protein [Bacteroidia bacterium]
MNIAKISTKSIFVITLIVIAAVSRLIPHEPNFTPLGAIALFSGVFIARKQLALIIPLAAILVSDILLEVTSGHGFHNTMIFVYSSVILITLLGQILRKRLNGYTLLGSSLAGSVLFFLVTNFGVWVMGQGFYPMTWTGLTECYLAGIPFFRTTVVSDLFYNAVLFGSFALVKWKFPRLVMN